MAQAGSKVRASQSGPLEDGPIDVVDEGGPDQPARRRRAPAGRLTAIL